MPAELERRLHAVRTAVLSQIECREPLIIVKAPPGSGKTRLIVDAAAYGCHRGRRIAVATQTNAQADDVCRRLFEEFPRIGTVRFARSGLSRDEANLPNGIGWATKAAELPDDPSVVVAPVAKWGFVEIAAAEAFDYLFVDEAWQMAWADFMLAGRQVASRFLLVGDPGQIPPVVSIDASRWITAPVPPQLAAPDVIEASEELRSEPLTLPATRRLPHDSVPIVRDFYDFFFDSWAKPGDRVYKPKRGTGGRVDRALDTLAAASMVGLELPTPPEGPPLEEDVDIAALAAKTAARIVDRGGSFTIDGERKRIGAGDVGITATHRVMNERIRQLLPKRLRDAIRVDTPERWQGLERPFLVAVHPISGVVRPSSFDLETGRLCVMASRHQVGVVIVTRDHIASTLESLTPTADQGVGQPDVTGKGHLGHLRFWDHLIDDGRVVRAG